uniref:LuxR C-terminal-related transcriptional regulator n=1 Tax=Rhizomonospora bruguierae TaxID=1581705 RepID=UPI0020BF3165
GRDADAARYAARRLALAPADAPLERATAHRELATAHGRLGRHAERLAALSAARGELEAAGAAANAAEWARLRAAEAEAHLDEGRVVEAGESARHARELVAAAADPATDAAAAVTLAAAYAAEGAVEPGLALLRAARRSAAERRDLATLSRAVGCLLDRYLPLLDRAPAWLAFDEAVAATTRHALERDTGRCILAGMRLAVRLGDATRAGELAAARLPLEAEPDLRARLCAAAGLLALAGGDEAAAGDGAAGADAAAERSERPSAWAAAALLRVALGAPLTVYLARVPVAYDRRRPARLLEAARWALAAGTEPAAVRAVLAERLPDVSPEERSLAQVRCALLAAEGEPEAAVEAGVAGLTGAPVAAWLDADTHLTVARCLLGLGRAAEARPHAERAVALLAGWPGPLADRAAALLGSLTAAADLTAREAEVLDCLTAGMSNKQVARSLGISVRTVGVHVSNLLRKTGTSSRTEAALWAVQHRRGGGH